MSAGPAFARFRALGTLVVVGVTEPETLDAAAAETRIELEACDAACSRFRPDSELSRINATPGRRELQGSAWLVEALAVACHAAAETGGLVDPTLGAALIAIGYDRSFEQIDPEAGPVAFVARRVGAWEAIRVNRRSGRVSVPAAVALDLGATAKALCSDRAATRAETATGAGVLVSIGGDLRTAGPAPADGWCIRVTDRADTPPDPPVPGQTISVDGGALATSGVAVRRWKREGKVLHHLLDPATGRPAATPWRTVTVAAPTCVEANLASTAAILLGRSAPSWLAARGVASRLVDQTGLVHTTCGWPRDEPGPHPGIGARTAA